MYLKFKIFIWAVCVMCPLVLHGQAGPESSKPKIGLVLSGGGAKGMAHVGVIKAMEEAGIRPDYVVGTSMGAVIGGLYAIGYNADELESIIMKADWDLIVSNRVSFNTIAFEEKEYYNRYLFELPVIKGKIAVPTGLIEGQKLSETLHYYTWPSIGLQDFDDFPIPFRCVTTDLRTGRGIVIESGYLPDALRSSIAIPSAFTPFDLDSTMVVDGGVVNNFPVDVAKDMGADIIIGVNVGDEDFVDPKELDSFSSILMQISMASSYRKLADNIAVCDVYIKPDLENYNTASFSSYKEILKLGHVAGEANKPVFEELADSLGIHQENPGIGLKADPIRISDISIKGNRLFSDELVRSRLDIAPKDTVSRSELLSGIDRVFGVNGFRKVDYNLKPTESGHYDLLIKTKEKHNTILNGAFHYDNLFSAGILLNLTMRDLLGKPSRTLGILDISQNPKFRIDHYKYLGSEKNYALNLRYNYLFKQIPEYEDGVKQDLFLNRETHLSANILTTHSLKQSFWVGGFYERARAQSSFNIAIPSEIRGAYYTYMGVRFLHTRNSLNDRNYPTAGAETIFEGVYRAYSDYQIKLKKGIDTLTYELGGETVRIPKEVLDETIETITPNGFISLFFNYVKFFPVNDRFQISPTVALGITLSNQEEDFSFSEFTLGGYQRVDFNDMPAWGLNYAELTAENFGKLGVNFQWLPMKNLYFRAGTNLLGHSEHTPISDVSEFDFDNFFSNQVIWGYGIDLTLDSFLGPITGGLSSNTKDGVIRPYLSIGFSFNYSDR
ncbi:alpha/beta hydrolase [Echinicola strongylocentroti]|uniref:Alpha/beta hydrolase n=1 Tax=Echinicola strongylocentroti TaxID=1795355 RepID=A0A2Z4IN74_9BACT|nr:patatin-like phospholipase family protein [Echinicola strongylocentroti]AWW32189.1 alpha/beta hydrolase [Echinicola strongylocentroti]